MNVISGHKATCDEAHGHAQCDVNGHSLGLQREQLATLNHSITVHPYHFVNVSFHRVTASSSSSHLAFSYRYGENKNMVTNTQRHTDTHVVINFSTGAVNSCR